MVVSGWVHRQQLIVIEFLQAENRMLKERLRGKRIHFTDEEWHYSLGRQRRRYDEHITAREREFFYSFVGRKLKRSIGDE